MRTFQPKIPSDAILSKSNTLTSTKPPSSLPQTSKYIKPNRRLLPPKPYTLEQTQLTPTTSSAPVYYKVTLKRGLIGLPHTVKKNATSLGLLRRHMTVYRRISEVNAGLILKLKELVSVELIDEIPKHVVQSTGYERLGNIIGNNGLAI